MQCNLGMIILDKIFVSDNINRQNQLPYFLFRSRSEECTSFDRRGNTQTDSRAAQTCHDKTRRGSCQCAEWWLDYGLVAWDTATAAIIVYNILLISLDDYVRKLDYTHFYIYMYYSVYQPICCDLNRLIQLDNSFSRN